VAVLQNSLVRERYVARTDFLTGLANRMLFFATAEAEIKRSHRYHLCLSAAYIDIDNFKQVNDRFGHAVGDRMLSMIAEAIRHNVRSVDLAARLGGDEFAVLLPQTDAASAKAALSKLKHLLQRVADENQWPVTFSCGVVTFLKPPASADEMIRRADEIMYAAKAESKNALRAAVFDS
jgi:diguanylate cyclase (GGDEF)-like protein